MNRPEIKTEKEQVIEDTIDSLIAIYESVRRYEAMNIDDEPYPSQMRQALNSMLQQIEEVKKYESRN